jgi:hypothetical protein
MSEGKPQRPAADGELWSLAEVFVEGTATAAERRRLEERLRGEPLSRLFYVAYLDLHAQLQWRTRGESARAAPQRAEQQEPPKPRRLSRFTGAPVRAALAASLLLAGVILGAYLVLRHGPEEGEAGDLPEPPDGSVAVLIDDSNTVWEKGTSLPTGTGSALPPGRLKLRSGVVEIAFHHGGEILLEGPADLEVSAPDRAFLHHGKLTARVPEGAPAFQVGMPGVVVTDRGGECGLWREETGLTEVHVFEGEVGASPTDGDGEPLEAQRLSEKAGTRVAAAPRTLTLTRVPLNEEFFAHLRPEIRVADASVRGGQFAGRNFGTVASLMVKNSIPDYTWDTYLRFDLAGVKGKVAGAKVRLVPLQVGQPLDNSAAFVSDNHWNETTITWDTKPASGPAFARWTVRQGEPVEFDVTPLVQAALAGDRRLSLRIFAPEYRRGSAFVQYGSRRGEADARPQLLLSLEP